MRKLGCQQRELGDNNAFYKLPNSQDGNICFCFQTNTDLIQTQNFLLWNCLLVPKLFNQASYSLIRPVNRGNTDKGFRTNTSMQNTIFHLLSLIDQTLLHEWATTPTLSWPTGHSIKSKRIEHSNNKVNNGVESNECPNSKWQQPRETTSQE